MMIEWFLICLWFRCSEGDSCSRPLWLPAVTETLAATPHCDWRRWDDDSTVWTLAGGASTLLPLPLKPVFLIQCGMEFICTSAVFGYSWQNIRTTWCMLFTLCVSSCVLREWSVLMPDSWSQTPWLRGSCSEERRTMPWLYPSAGGGTHLIYIYLSLVIWGVFVQPMFIR